MPPHGLKTRRRGVLPLLAVLLVTPLLAGCMGMGSLGEDHGGDHGQTTGTPSLSPLDRSVAGLPPSAPTTQVNLTGGAVFNLTAGLVAHSPTGGQPIRMFAYNGQIPGPTLRAPQGATVDVLFRNDLPVETTVHWHGLRLEAGSDGVPHVSQPPVPPGGTFRYRLSFPDEGVFWYHPHVREDLQQELGLQGAILVDGPRDAAEAWPREEVVLLDDLLLDDTGDVAPFSSESANRVLMGRYGNEFLANGRSDLQLTAAPGERVRLHLIDSTNARPFRLAVAAAASVQLVGLDGGYLGQPVPFEPLTLSPGERATLDIVMPAEGSVQILHAPPAESRELMRIAIDPLLPKQAPAEAPQGPHNRARAEMAPALARADDPVDLTWDLDVQIAGATTSNPHAGHGGGASQPTEEGSAEPIEWETGDMEETNAGSTPETVTWVIRDAESGRENEDLNYSFQQGSFVKIRIRNLETSAHPMQHPIHLHGQRFIVNSIDGVENPIPAWKDVVLVPAGSEAVITVEMSNPGTWVFHCHINEHLEADMEGRFTVAA
ncbi:MAG TPA: multicopper oxidase family protein [Candidatus Thermoplasmatota archaeon]|nr:multicopper oxidase family protein [Candidatus Thermoplasmatota archaeon]